MGLQRFFILSCMIFAIPDNIAGQESSCSKCIGDNRFEPQVTDMEILRLDAVGTSPESFYVYVRWSGHATMCCSGVHYMAEFIQAPTPTITELENCSKLTTNSTTSTNTTFNVELSYEMWILQISAEYSDGDVTRGPCHVVNVTSYITNSMTYQQPRNTDVNVSVAFESCQSIPNGQFIPPSYELNGMVFNGGELQNYITHSENGEIYFTVSNVTEDTVLLEYCVDSSGSGMTCDLCKRQRQDRLLSRSVVTIANDGLSTVDTPFTYTVSGFTVETSATTNSSVIASSEAQLLHILLPVHVSLLFLH